MSPSACSTRRAARARATLRLAPGCGVNGAAVLEGLGEYTHVWLVHQDPRSCCLHKPPLGWQNWNGFGMRFNASLFKDMATAMKVFYFINKDPLLLLLP